MLLLTSVTDLVQVVTSSAASLQVHASWVDNATGTITPGRTNTAISTATTTTVVGSPAASTQRTVQRLVITNTHTTDANTVTVQHTDGTVAVPLFKVTLEAGEIVAFDGEDFALVRTEKQIPFSASSGGRGIKVAATATPGTTIHATDIPVSSRDEVWLYAYNDGVADIALTIEFGGTTVPDDTTILVVPSRAAVTLVLPGLVLAGTGSAARTIAAFAETADKIVVTGHVNRIA